jgi:hypothetical protein
MFESNADLSNMANESLLVSDALHKAFVEVGVCACVCFSGDGNTY